MRPIIEQPEGWEHLQTWFQDFEDPLRPWNVSAIGRKLKLPQSVVRSLLKGPKDSEGMTRTAFTRQRLRQFVKLFAPYGYRPASAKKQSPPVAPLCRPVTIATHLQPIVVRFSA